MPVRHLPAILSAVFTMSACCAHGGIAGSTFDADREGWTVLGDAPAVPSWVAVGGNPSGYVESLDDTTGGVWYWDAPHQFLGDVSAAFGGALSYDLRQSDISDPFGNDDVILSNGSTTIALHHAPPGTQWTSYTALLNSTENWRLGTEDGPVASDQDILAVLESLQSLRIRGEYRVGEDLGGLDNVILTPETTTLTSLVLLSGILIARRH